jgi:hypothetical protein
MVIVCIRNKLGQKWLNSPQNSIIFLNLPFLKNKIFKNRIIIKNKK